MARKSSCLLIAVFVAMLSISAARSRIVSPDYRGTPVEFGLGDLNAALANTADVPTRISLYVGCAGGKTASSAAVTAALNVLPQKAESFVIARAGDDIAIIGRDQVHTMYGCFELAERLTPACRELPGAVSGRACR